MKAKYWTHFQTHCKVLFFITLHRVMLDNYIISRPTTNNKKKHVSIYFFSINRHCFIKNN